MNPINIAVVAAAIAGFSNGAMAEAAATDAVATPARTQSTGAYVEDSVITTKVKAAILRDPVLKSVEVNVETHKGIVQLSGFVRSRADIDKAVRIARRTKGVASVKNDMIIKGQQ